MIILFLYSLIIFRGYGIQNEKNIIENFKVHLKNIISPIHEKKELKKTSRNFFFQKSILKMFSKKFLEKVFPKKFSEKKFSQNNIS